MIFLANRANLDKRRLLSRIHNWLHTQATSENGPIEEVWYHTSAGNKIGVRASLDAPTFIGADYPVHTVELHVSFDVPENYSYDFYRIHWVEPEREFMLGWYQNDTHSDLGECHLQIDYQGETVQREAATFLDSHPLNVFNRRTDHLEELVTAVSWETDRPHLSAIGG